MPSGGSGGKGLPFSFVGADPLEQVVVLESKGLKITAFRVDHAHPGQAMVERTHDETNNSTPSN